MDEDDEVYVGAQFTRLSRSASYFSRSVTAAPSPVFGSSVATAIMVPDEDVEEQRALEEMLDKDQALLDPNKGYLIGTVKAPYNHVVWARLTVGLKVVFYPEDVNQCQRTARKGQVGMARKVRWRLRGKEQSTSSSYYVYILARSLLSNLSISLFSNFLTISMVSALTNGSGPERRWR